MPKCIRQLCRWVTKADIQKHKARLLESIRRTWPGHKILIEELIFHDDGRDGIAPAEDEKNNGIVQPAGSIQRKVLVFIDKELDIDWLTNFTLTQDRLDLIAELTNVESAPNKHLPKAEILAFKRMIGLGIVAAIGGSLDQAQIQKELAQHYLEKRITEHSRLWSLAISTALVLPFLLLAWKKNSLFIDEPMKQGAAFIACATAGVFGSYLSLVRRTAKACMDSSAGWLLHFLEITAKLIAGIVFGVMTYFICQTSIAPESIKDIANGADGLVALAFIAGFSERFIPRMISNYQPYEEKKEGK